jgi:hypothetical protein
LFEWYEIVGLIGATLIFTSGYIFDELRNLAAKINKHFGIFVACSMCIGFWAGFAYCYFYRKEFALVEAFLFGCSISLLAYVTDIIIILIERATGVLLQKVANNTTAEHDIKQ